MKIVKKHKEYVLCAGSFLFLVLAAKNDSARRRNNNGVDEPNCIMDLIKISGLEVDPFVDKREVGNVLSKFKMCKDEAPRWLLFGSDDYVQAMEERVENDYKQTLTDIIVWANKYLDLETNGAWLCRALLELVYYDNSVDDENKIYAGPEGEQFSFTELYNAELIHAQSFLLGLWYYIVKENRLNKSGIDTVNHFKPSEDDKNERGTRSSVGKLCNFQWNVRILKLEKASGYVDGKPIWNSRDMIEEPIRPLIPSANKMLALSDDSIALPDHDYDEYLDSIYDNYKEISTLIYHKEPRLFNSIYVCNNVVRPGFKPTGGSDSSRKVLYANSISDLSFRIIKDYRYHFIIIVGTGGLGKSMMLTHLLLDSVENYYDYRILPLFVSLREYSDKYEDFLDYLYSEFDSFGGRIPKNNFDDFLCAGKFLVLLDGMDEIPGKYKKHFENSISRFIRGHRRSYFIMSSRPSDEAYSLGRFRKAELLPLTYSQSLEVIDKLDTDMYPQTLKDEFVESLENGLKETHREFIENPLLLTMMFMTYKQKSDIPKEMFKFYEKVYETLFTEHDSIKPGFDRELKTNLKQDEFAEYFEEFCFLSYQEDNKLDLSDDDCKYIFEDMDIVHTKKPDFGWRDFIYDLVHSICLIYEEGDEKKYHYIHRSIQEYFCARYFAKQPDKDLYAIAMYFEDHDEKHHDSTFDMLYAMKPLSVEEEVFLPYLKDIFEMQEDEKSEEDVYKRFLYTNYLLLHFDVGDVPASVANCTFPVPFLYRYIGEKKGLVADYFDTYLDVGKYDYEEFHMDTYVMYDYDFHEEEVFDGVFQYFHGENYEIVTRNEVPEEYEKAFDMPDTCGASYEVNVEEVLEDDTGVYDELAAQILDHNFPLYLEFKRMENYYHELKSKKKEARVSLRERLRRKGNED